MTKTVDMTPKWSECVSLLVHLLKNGTTQQAREIALEEIERMAQTADAYVESQKLPDPPKIIKIDNDFNSSLDLRDPIHAAAYIRAAGHFLSSWPQEWDAETLALALLAEEEDDEENLANQKKIFPWDAIENSTAFQNEGGPMFLEEIIHNLAVDFLDFAKVSA